MHPLRNITSFCRMRLLLRFAYKQIYNFIYKQAPVIIYSNFIYFDHTSFIVQEDPNEPKRDPDDQGPKLDSVAFWHKLVALMASVVEEDINSYSTVLNQFPQELNIGQVIKYFSAANKLYCKNACCFIFSCN